jgi:CDGSH-type Zn-finger protein
MSQPVVIRCRENGPLVVVGDVTIVDHTGNTFTPPATTKANIVLCRCGQSKNRPFCDGSHHEVGFTAAETAPAP